MSSKYEYRLLTNKDWVWAAWTPIPDREPGYSAEAYSREFPELAPFRVERRVVGEWEEVRTEE